MAGDMYRKGIAPAPQDFGLARFYYTQASEAGVAAAQHALGARCTAATRCCMCSAVWLQRPARLLWLGHACVQWRLLLVMNPKSYAHYVGTSGFPLLYQACSLSFRPIHNTTWAAVGGTRLFLC